MRKFKIIIKTPKMKAGGWITQMAKISLKSQQWRVDIKLKLKVLTQLTRLL